MINLNAIFQLEKNQGTTNLWKAKVGIYELFIWAGGMQNSVPGNKLLSLNDYSDFAFQILFTMEHAVKIGKGLTRFNSDNMIDLFGFDLSRYPSGTAFCACHVPIDVVRGMVEKVIRLTNPMPDDAGDGE